VSRGQRIGAAAVALLGGFVFFLLTIGSLGEPQPDVARIGVSEVLTHAAPADHYGAEELYVSGWYASLDSDCVPEAGGGPDATWMERTCPLRVLWPEQPPETVTQAQLLAGGLRLTAPTGAAFPSRARPEGPNLQLQQLVFVGHFDDPAAADCAAALRERCRNTFVVTDYDGLLR
jgi:hypothetical protein